MAFPNEYINFARVKRKNNKAQLMIKSIIVPAVAPKPSIPQRKATACTKLAIRLVYTVAQKAIEEPVKTTPPAQSAVHN